MSGQDNEIYNVIINGYYTFNQYTDNINMIIAKILQYTKLQFPNLTSEEILESIKNIFVIENIPLPNITDSEIIELVDNPINHIVSILSSLSTYDQENDDDEYEVEINQSQQNNENIVNDLDDENEENYEPLQQSQSEQLPSSLPYIMATPNNIILPSNGLNQLPPQIQSIISHIIQNNNGQHIQAQPLQMDQQINSFLEKKVNVVIDKNKLKKFRNRQYKFLAPNIKKMNKCCSICLDDYEEITKVKILSCKHAFHSDCITKWLTEENYKCPVCRKEIGEEDDHIAISN